MTPQGNGHRKLKGLRAVARRYDVTPRTIQRWISESDYPASRSGPGKTPRIIVDIARAEQWEHQRGMLPVNA